LNCFFILGNNSGGGPYEAREGPGFDRENGRKAGVGGGRAGRLRVFDLEKQSLRREGIRCAARARSG